MTACVVSILCAMLVGGAAADGLGHAPVANDVAFDESEIRRIRQHIAVALPPDPTNRFADDPAAARFGQFIFFDTSFSSNGQVSCATCHDPGMGFADGKQRAEGLETVDRHSMSLWHVGHQRWYFWDGRADSLWSQATQPFENPREMGFNRVRLARTILHNDALRAAYEELFGAMPPLDDAERFPADARPIAAEPSHPHHVAWAGMAEADQDAVSRVLVNVGKSIAAYVRRLSAGDSPFDRFAGALASGDPTGGGHLSLEAQRGLKLFIGPANCRLCHAGPNFSDGEFHNNLLPALGGGMPTDPGRLAGLEKVLADPFNAAGAYSDDPDGPAAKRLQFLRRSPELWGQFKTPGLRNVALSPPYMHQGQFQTLRDVVVFYATLEGQVPIGHHQETTLVPLALSDHDISDMISFLESLTSEPPDDSLMRPPAGPALGDDGGDR